ncbi:MAG: DUF1800 family protein, partial [Achromobacter kerstersii]
AAMAILRQMGQGLYQRPTPDGYPLAMSDWSGSGQMTQRFEIARTIAAAPQVFYRLPDDTQPLVLPRLPNLLTSASEQGLFTTLSPATRDAIAQAKTPADANTYLLASPEFMRR